MGEESLEEFLEEVEETEKLEELMKKEEHSVNKIMLVAIAVFLFTVFVIAFTLPTLLDSVL